MQSAKKTHVFSLCPICPFSRFYHFAIFASASKCSNRSPTISGYLDQIIESTVYTATIHMPSTSGAYDLFIFGERKNYIISVRSYIQLFIKKFDLLARGAFESFYCSSIKGACIETVAKFISRGEG